MRKFSIFNFQFSISLLLFTFYFLLFTFSARAAGATLSLSPATKSVVNGQTFSLEIRVNTGGESINTVTANLTYPTDKLRAQSVDTAGSFVTIWFENNIGTASGEVRLTGSLPTPGTSGSNLLFATVNFVALNTGTANVEFTNSSAVYRNSDNSDILGSTQDGTYTITEVTPTATPTPTTITAPTGTPTPTTGQGNLPDVGVELPTLILFAFALIFITFGSVLLRVV
ncbi:MAG: hypothetical protein FJ044_03100 [Candidatus Cloacimonetes bacterium]|nr:hypothetical protein [Candidatus Cloacimonadota bacterium]